MRGRESSGIYARCCDVLRSVTVGALSFAVVPGYVAAGIPTMDSELGASCMR